MKKLFLLLILSLGLMSIPQAQVLNKLKNAAKKTVEKTVEAVDKAVSNSVETTKEEVAPTTNNTNSNPISSINIGNGKTYYVCSSTGSNRNDGSKSSPFKNIQKALDVASEGSTILVAEGNYYGLLNSGNIVITKPVTLIGGYSSDFSKRDVLTYKTMIQPTLLSNGSAKGGGTIQLKSIVAPNDKVVIDGFIIDRGNSIAYNKDGKGKPQGVESPMMCPIGAAGIGGDNFAETGLTTETSAIYFEGYQGVVNNVQLIVRNCTFANLPNFALVGIAKAPITMENNIFVNVRMAILHITGGDKDKCIPITFRNNTVLFVWTRKNDLDEMDMGFGFRMTPGTSNILENNIFACCASSAIDRLHVDSNKDREAQRKDVVKNNIFFLNRLSDLALPGGGKFLRVRAEDFDDVEQLATVSNNRTLSDPKIFNNKINMEYLQGFINMKASTNVSVDYNSTANQFRSAFGMNIQGTGSTTTTMFANRYPWQEALKLFGAVQGCGAQVIRN